MDRMVAHIVDEMKKHPPYSINSVISAICVCFAQFLGIDFCENEKVTSAILVQKVSDTVSAKKYPQQLFEAFEILCMSIANNDLLWVIYSSVKQEYRTPDWKTVLEILIKTEFLEQLGSGIATPAPLNELCLELLQPVNGTFYDGTAGIGSTSIDAYLYSKSCNGTLALHMQDSNPLCYAVSIIRTFLFHIDNCFVYFGDTLTDPKTSLDDRTLQQFDYSIMFPPIGFSWKNISEKVQRDSFRRFLLDWPPTSSADWLFIQQQFASLKTGGKGIIAVPSGALFNTVTGKLREAAIRAGIIECIITLPSNMLPYTNIPISLMIISGTKKADSQIQMIQADRLFAGNQPARKKDSLRLDASVIQKISQLYHQKQEVPEVSTLVDVDKLKANDWILLPSRYVHVKTVATEYGDIIINYSTNENWCLLKDIGSFYRGINMSSYATADENGSFKIINYADVQDGKLQTENLNKYRLTQNTNTQKYLVLPGDVLISCKGTAIKICIVPGHTESILLSINFIGIHVDIQRFNPMFIKYYLESPAGQTFLQSKQVGTSITTLTTRDLEQIPFPALPLHDQNRHIEDLVHIEEKIQKEMEQLYTQSQEARWTFYQNIGLGTIMKKDDAEYEN